jgi:hypothetical protein
MSLCACAEHGNFLARLKFRAAEDDTWTVNRILYKADAEMEKFYSTKAHPPRRSRSRRKRKKAVQS